MKRFFYACLICVCVFLAFACSADNVPSSGTSVVPVLGENRILCGADDDFFIIARQKVQGEYNIYNSSYSYKYTDYSVSLTPLTVYAEQRGAQAIFQGEEIRFSEGKFTAAKQGVLTEDSIIFFEGESEKEVYFETDITVDCEKAIGVLRDKRGEAISDDGGIAIKFIINFGEVFIFCGFYESERLVCAVLCDTEGEYITHI